ncbi:MAG: hypothetical protein MMC33_005416 [Icmadophila ericetorum]|nr:hypothetical protein [Icmadophila ericetorum]
MITQRAKLQASIPRKDAVLSRREIEGLIADGRTITIVDGKVLKVDAWLAFHPGGGKAIQHMVGRDATDEVNALHSSEARERMRSYQIGVINGRWKNFLPPIQGGQFRSYKKKEGPADKLNIEESTSSSDSSPSASPIFDTLDTVPRKRKGHVRQISRDDEDASSISSISSTDLATLNLTEGAAEIAAYTRKEIESDLAKYPSLDPVIQDEITHRYRHLKKRMEDEELFKCNYYAYMIEISRYMFLFSMCLLTLRLGWYAVSGLFLGVFWHQLVFTAHDAGHMGITHNFTVDTVIGIIVADFLGGLSMGWWKRNHNVHHIVTNSPEHDPDIEHMPFFAISHRFFESLRSTYYERIMAYDSVAKFAIRYQKYLYYPLLTMGRFNLYRLSWEYLILGLGPKKGPAWWHRWLELAGQVFFWTWFGYGIIYKCIPTTGGRIAFIMVSHMVTAPLHVQITLSHFAMSTADLGVHESFAQKMLRTTMDVDCPEWLDFVHGGLQFQAIHHLYPRMPRHNLRKAQKLVQEFCQESGIPYALYGFVDGNKEVLGRLGEVGKQAAILAACQKALAENSDYGHR